MAEIKGLKLEVYFFPPGDYPVKRSDDMAHIYKGNMKCLNCEGKEEFFNSVDEFLSLIKKHRKSCAV
ncbi:MAG: hypothetical protein ACFFCD_07630 [Promethearchaeota archaeon]